MKSPRHRDDDANRRADRLKERIYITFTALAVTVALYDDADHLTAGRAAATLAIAVIGTLLAVLVADVVSHVAVRAALPDRVELLHMASVSAVSLGVLVIPMLLVALSAVGVWGIREALTASASVLIATLVFVAYLAVRRLRLPAWQRLLVLLTEALLGLLVLALETVSH